MMRFEIRREGSKRGECSVRYLHGESISLGKVCPAVSSVQSILMCHREQELLKASLCILVEFLGLL